MAVKAPNQGLLLRGAMKVQSGIIVPPSGYEDIIDGAIWEAHHVDMMPVAGGPLFVGDGIQANNGVGLETTVQAYREWNNENPLQKKYIRVRPEMGNDSTAGWLFTSAGTINFVTSGKQPKPGICVPWWSTNGLNGYTDWITKLGAYCDSIPEILTVAVGLGGMYSAEVFIRWSMDVLAAWNGSGGALTCNKDLAALKTALDCHVAAFPNTWTLIDVNKHQDSGLTGTPTAYDYTRAALDYLVAECPIVVMTNASADTDADQANLSLIQSYGPQGSGQAVISCQTLQIAQLEPPAGNTPGTVAGRTTLYQQLAGDGSSGNPHGYGISSCELPDTSTDHGDTHAVLAAFRGFLLANGPTTVIPPPPGSIAPVQQWGAFQAGSGGAGAAQIGTTWGGFMTVAGTVLSFPTLAGKPLVAGATVVLNIGDRVLNGTTISTVVDTLGNTWAQQGARTGSPLRYEAWTSLITNGGVSTITITAAKTSELSCEASQWSGLGSAVPEMFITAKGVAGSGPASVAATVASSAGALVIGGVLAVGAPTLGSEAFSPAGTSFNVPEAQEDSTGGDAVILECSETLAAGSAIQSYSASITGTQAWIAFLMSFRATNNAVLVLPPSPAPVQVGDTVLLSLGDRVTGGTTFSAVVDANNPTTNVFTVIPAAVGTNGVLRAEVWICDVATGGTMLIEATPVNGAGAAEGRASEWNGLAGTPVDKVAVATGSASAASATTASSAGGDLVYSTVVATGSPTLSTRTFTPGAGSDTDFYKPDTAEQSTGSLNSILETSATLAGATGTQQYSVAGPASGWICIVVTFKGAAASATAPGAPTAVVAIASDGSANVSWTPGPDNGSPTTQFTVTPFDVATSTSLTPIVIAGSPPTPSCTAAPLTDGDPVTFTVTQTNSAGTSAASAASAPVTPQPTIVVTPPVASQAVTIPGPRPAISQRYAELLQQ